MKFTLIFFIVVFLSITGYTQTTNDDSETKQLIMKLENEWMIAMMKKDETTLNKIVAPEYKLDGTDPFDKPAISRQMWMENTMQNLKVDSVHYYKMNVDVIENIAIVKSTFYWSGSFFGKSFTDSTSVLVDTWMKRKQGWQVVSRIRTDKVTPL